MKVLQNVAAIVTIAGVGVWISPMMSSPDKNTPITVVVTPDSQSIKNGSNNSQLQSKIRDIEDQIIVLEKNKSIDALSRRSSTDTNLQGKLNDSENKISMLEKKHPRSENVVLISP